MGKQKRLEVGSLKHSKRRNSLDIVDLSIIIVNWNTHHLLAQCLKSILKNARLTTELSVETLVVDNASSDGSAAMVRNEFPEIHLIESRQNLGFAQGNNQAMPLCKGRYILLLNPDTVVKPHALDTLVEFMDTHPGVGAAGSRLLNPDGSLQPSCHPRPTLSRELWRLFHLDVFYPYGRYRMHKWSMATPREVDVLQGASMILRKEVLDEIGFLDSDYFMYSEEVDLSYRLQKAGWHLYWVPQSQVVHYGGQSTKQVAAEMFLQLYRGKLVYFRKHYGQQAGIKYKFILLAASLARLLLVPLMYLRWPSKRNNSLLLARHYGRLLAALPKM